MVNFKIGNNYNFNPSKVLLFEGETRDTLKTLNKVEIRYNTRRDLPNYPAMKSLYKWRSVFGYRLGGLLRRAVVKFAEIGRHGVNAKNYWTAFKNAREPQVGKAEKMKVFDMKDLTNRQAKLGNYVRLYSTRDIILALKADNNDTLGLLKYLKYQTWNQTGAVEHQVAKGNDYSLRSIVLEGAINLRKPKEDEIDFVSVAKTHNYIVKHENEESLIEFKNKRDNDFDEMKKNIIEEYGNEPFYEDDFKYKSAIDKNKDKNGENNDKTQPKLDYKTIRTGQYNEEGMPILRKEVTARHQQKPVEIEKPKLIKDMSEEELMSRFPRLREIKEREFVPKNYANTDVARDANSADTNDRLTGKLKRALIGGTVGKLVRAGKIIKFQLGVMKSEITNQPKTNQTLKEVKERLSLDKKYSLEDGFDNNDVTTDNTNEGETTLRDILENIHFGRKI